MRVSLSKDAEFNVERSEVLPKTLFSNKDSKSKVYMALPNGNDRAYSINTSTGSLASCWNMNRPVRVRGYAEFVINNVDPAHYVTKTRGEVEPGEVFIVPGSRAAKNGENHIYVHIGNTTDGKYISFNPATDKTASTKKETSTVTVVGNATIDARYV